MMATSDVVLHDPKCGAYFDEYLSIDGAKYCPSCGTLGVTKATTPITEDPTIDGILAELKETGDATQKAVAKAIQDYELLQGEILEDVHPADICVFLERHGKAFYVDDLMTIYAMVTGRIVAVRLRPSMAIQSAKHFRDLSQDILSGAGVDESDAVNWMLDWGDGKTPMSRWQWNPDAGAVQLVEEDSYDG